MVKTIFKEIIIVLLLCIAILLVLSVLFYDYNPLTKVVPNKIAYTVPENIKNELEEESVSEEFSIQNKVYTIEGSDLNIYRKGNAYNPKQDNPFESISGDNTNTNVSGNTEVNTNIIDNNNNGGGNKTPTNPKPGLK